MLLAFLLSSFFFLAAARPPTAINANRTRKRRTRSYDPVKTPSGDHANGNGRDESESDAWTSPDRGGAPSFIDSARRGGVPTTLFGGAPSVYDSKLMAVRKSENFVCMMLFFSTLWCVFVLLPFTYFKSRSSAVAQSKTHARVCGRPGRMN